MSTKKAARSSTKKGDQIITNVYLSERAYDRLKKLSEATGAPMAHYIREGVEMVLERYSTGVFKVFAKQLARGARKGG